MIKILTILLIILRHSQYFSQIFSKVEKRSSKVDQGLSKSGTVRVLLHFPGIGADQKKGQWYLDEVKRDEHLNAAVFGVVPPGDWRSDELNEALLPLPVMQTDDSIYNYGNHYDWGSPDFSHQGNEGVNSNAQVSSPFRKKMQAFLEDSSDDEIEILSSKNYAHDEDAHPYSMQSDSKQQGPLKRAAEDLCSSPKKMSKKETRANNKMNKNK